MSKFKRVSVLLMAAVMIFTVAACGPSAEEEQETLDIAFVFDGPVGDHGYNYAHDLGRQAVEEEYGDRVNVTSVEDIPAVDVKEVVERLIDEGNEYIVGNTFAFE
jgi:simple sugar transport system substrate-binding protein